MIRFLLFALLLPFLSFSQRVMNCEKVRVYKDVQSEVFYDMNVKATLVLNTDTTSLSIIAKDSIPMKLIRRSQIGSGDGVLIIYMAVTEHYSTATVSVLFVKDAVVSVGVNDGESLLIFLISGNLEDKIRYGTP